MLHVDGGLIKSEAAPGLRELVSGPSPTDHALSVGFDPHAGMPIGAQLTADHESLRFDIGKDCQAATDWLPARAGVRVGHPGAEGAVAS